MSSPLNYPSWTLICATVLFSFILPNRFIFFWQAEMFPDNSSDVHFEGQEDPSPFSYWLENDSSTSPVNNLRVMDPEGKKIKTTHVFMEKDKNIKVDQRKDAVKYNVKLKGSKQPRSPKKQPSMEWLDSDASTYYLSVSFGK